jgi:MYXO-CTERM domain-containing protein
LQEAAHAFGLDHIDGEENIMYPFSTFGTKVWATGCTPYNAATGPIGCGYIHEVFCPEGDAQNDDAELLAYFGPNAPDVEAPVVTIVEPAPDLMLASGGSTSIVAEITDDHLGHGWRLRVVPPAGEALIRNAYQFETSWDLDFAGQPDGAYELWIEAVDHDGNEGSAMVTVYVGVDPPIPGTDESGDGSGSADSGDGTGVGTGETTPSDGDGTGDTAPADDDGGEGSCECSADRGPSPAAWGWLPVLVLATAGRSRDRSRSRNRPSRAPSPRSRTAHSRPA